MSDEHPSGDARCDMPKLMHNVRASLAGMNELQTAMALGVMQQSDSSDYGNRTIEYDAGGAHWSVTFENDKATQAQQTAATAQ